MVSHSVAEVLEECDRLLQLADSVDRVDVMYSVQELTNYKKELESAYSDERYNEKEATYLKRECEISALKLEDKLASNFESLMERKELRNRIHDIYNKSRTKVLETSTDAVAGNVSDLLSKYNVVKKFQSEAEHLILVLNTDELAELAEIELNL